MNKYITLPACLMEWVMIKIAQGTKNFSAQDVYKYIPWFQKKTNIQTKTPKNSLQQTLQKIRNCGIINFIDNRGNYEIIGEKIYIHKLLNSYGNRSYGEKIIKSILDDWGIVYEEQKIFRDLKDKGYLRYDFYIEHGKNKILIEFDGVQHENPIEHFGGEKAFNILKKHDKMKDNYAVKNEMKLIRISFSQKRIEQSFYENGIYSYKIVSPNIRKILEKIIFS